MKLKFTVNDKLDDSRTIMRCFGFIGDQKNGMPFFDARYFTDEMYWHASYDRKVVCYINSPGGSVDQGYPMCQAILDCGADTHNVFMAASMGAILAMFGKKRTCNDFSLMMLHYPSGENKKLVSIIGDRMKSVIMSNSKFSQEEMDNLMNPQGKDLWLDSSDMQNKGLIDAAPIYTGKKINSPKVRNATEIYQIYCQLNGDTTKKSMSKVTALLDLDDEASENAQVKAIKKLQEEADEAKDLKKENIKLEAQVQSLKNEKTTLETSMLEQKKANAKTLVSNAITAKKIKEEAREKWEKLATENYEVAASALGDIAPARGSVTDVTASDQIDITVGKEDTYEYLAKYEPEKLRAIAERDPVKFEKLQDAYILAKNKELNQDAHRQRQQTR